MLKTLGKTTWDKIKINEVFAVNGCIEIWIKETKDDVRFIETDDLFLCDVGVERENNISLLVNINPGEIVRKEKLEVSNGFGGFYKLPKSVQKLFKEE